MPVMNGLEAARVLSCLAPECAILMPTIQYGGYFLLTSLMHKGSGWMENPLRQNFFRAGHAPCGRHRDPFVGLPDAR
jgi:hypothetical protein